MFCPQCKSEYVEGITQCAACRVDLIQELPVEMIEKPEYVDYVEILSTNNPADIAVLKSILESENIPYYFHGENFNRMYPQVEPARLMIRKDEAEKAHDLIHDLKLTQASISLENTENGDLSASEPQIEENTGEDEPMTNLSFSKAKYFISGLIIGMILVGLYTAYYIYDQRHFSGTDKSDFNNDGRPDAWYIYSNGRLTRCEFDQNFDGKVDFWYFYKDSIIDRGQADTDFNGVPDITYYYVDGMIDSAEYRPNGSRVIFKKEFYENGVLKEEWIDQDRDGKFDLKILYDFLQNPIQTIALP